MLVNQEDWYNSYATDKNQFGSRGEFRKEYRFRFQEGVRGGYHTTRLNDRAIDRPRFYSKYDLKASSDRWYLPIRKDSKDRYYLKI